MNPTMILAVAIGGALGSTARYLTNIGAGKFLGTDFPYGTMIVNIIGSFIIGYWMESMALRWNVGMELRAFLIVGILGGFTTFSAFSLDAILLLQRGQTTPAVIYICASVLLSLLATILGIICVRGLPA
ncbi:MAG: fluoride efflux transporter CrcB [Alphaproteobacteria bacterium]|nr:MAG: fluoride efflux transporter CrcB [Alphaproteobacteria bacterium]